MRIAIISFHFAKFTMSLANELALSHKVMLFLHANNAKNELANFKEYTQQKNLSVVLLPFIKSGNPFGVLNAIKTVQAILGFKPDVVHVQESLRDYEALSILFLLRYPLVLTIHDHIPHTGASENIVKRKVWLPLLRFVPDVVIVHGNRIMTETEDILPRLKGRIFSIPLGAFGPIFKPFNSNWEIGNLLFFGRIEEYKGVGYFIEAVRLLHEKGIPVKGVIAGKGELINKYLETISQSPCFELINKYIPASMIPDLFQNANVIVLPYTDATQSGVMSFALGYGRPAVATNVGGLPEVVRSGHNGILVPPKDINALTNAIETLIKDQHKATQMGYNAYLLARNEFSWKEVAHKTIAVYNEAILLKKHNRRY